MPGSRSQTIRRSLHLSIDPSPFSYRKTSRRSFESISPVSSAHASVATSYTGSSPPDSEGLEWVICRVLCLHDFDSSDPDHLPFSKNEILDIVKQESSGWWAALRQDGGQVGWIPSAYVQPLSSEMFDRLRNVREELRVFEYDAERLYNSAPITHLDLPKSQPSLDVDHGDEWVPMMEGVKAPSMQLVTPTDLIARRDFSTPTEGKSGTYFQDAGVYSSPVDDRPRPPPSPVTPMPQPPPPLKPSTLLLNKPTPPIPRHANRSTSFSPTGSILHTSDNDLSRSHSDTAVGILNAGRNVRRRPMLLDDRASLSRLSTLIETNNVPGLEMMSSPEMTGSIDSLSRSSYEKKKSTDEELQNPKLIQAHLPWYLRPSYNSDDIKVDVYGNVKAGTLNALVERLTDPFATTRENVFRNAFLMTFRTFTTADQLFEMLVERYQMDHADKLTTEEFEEWKELKLRPTQKRVLTVFTAWLENHRLLEEEPHIAQKLTDFLSLILTPAPFAITAKLIQESLERLTFAHPNPSSPVSPQRKRKPKAHRNELLRFDPADVAEQLCLLEYMLYSKITPQECINWSSSQAGKGVANLVAFCETHDNIAAWVKTSILTNDVLGKRADTVDFWIKVAEKCRNMNNFSSTSALLTALNSTVITRLHLTWAHAGRKSHLDPLLRLNEPSGSFGAYRNLQQAVDGPCVPFLTMLLTDIVHVGDQYTETVSASSPETPPLIHFKRRERWYEVISTMLRHQLKPYNLADNEPTRKFIEGHLRDSNGKDQGWFWLRSQEVQQLELAHADIRKGLEAAGF